MSVFIEQALWFSARARLQLKEAEKHFKYFRYPECVSCAQDSIEYSLKAIFEFLGQQYPPDHNVVGPLTQLLKRLPHFKKEISRAIFISSRWTGRTRSLARYGEYILKTPGTVVFRKSDAEVAISDALEICDLLHRIETKKKFELPIKIGILDGYVEGPDVSEKPCGTYPFTNFRIEDWKRYFSQIVVNGTNKYEVETISASKISNKFVVIINPFGEAYPEKDLKERTVFGMIRDFIFEGGIFVNTGGFAFFYAWNVNEGREQPILDEKIFLPATIRSEEGRVIVEQFQIMLPFAGSLLWREFNARTTADTTIHSGPFSLEVFQRDEDKQIAGELVNVGGSDRIEEFRALTKDTKNLVPLLRASRPDFGEVYPVGAIQYGRGYLLIGGMNVTSDIEFQKLAMTVDNFCNWVAGKV